MTGYHSPNAPLRHWCRNGCGTIVEYGKRCPKCYPSKKSPVAKGGKGN